MIQRIICTAFLLSLIAFNLRAHDEWVHQHMVKEAYKLLKLQLGYDILIMKDRIQKICYSIPDPPEPRPIAKSPGTGGDGEA